MAAEREARLAANAAKMNQRRERHVMRGLSFVCGGHDTDPRVQALHPPIDGLLLEELYHRDVGGLRHEWSKARATRWSNFTSDQYENVILSIRKALGRNVPLWRVEQYWRGYQ